MPIRTAKAVWKGTLPDGTGEVESESGALKGRYSYGSRFEEGTGTNPEELIAAAHAGCFAMALAGALGKAGHPPESIEVEGRVTLEREEEGFRIKGIRLVPRATVPGIGQDAFREQVEAAKKSCPVSHALKALPIEVDAHLSG